MMQVNVENAFNNVFQAIILKELCDVEELLASIVPFTGCFMVFIILLIIDMGNMWKRSPLLNHFQA
jgi:hypothetical protein